MIFDILDYILGAIKICIYSLFYFGRLQVSLTTKYSRSLDIRIWKNSKVQIGKQCSIRSGVKLRTYGGNIVIGKRVGINNGCCINAMKSIKIGDEVILGQNVCIYDHDHRFGKNIVTRNSGFDIRPITIGNNVWIGSNCVILKGITIGDNCVIAAGTIVREDIPANVVAYDKRKLMLKDVKELV